MGQINLGRVTSTSSVFTPPVGADAFYNYNGSFYSMDANGVEYLLISATPSPAGTSGTSGFNGTSGTSGATGPAGTSGTSGVNGTSGTSGVNGTSGIDGSATASYGQVSFNIFSSAGPTSTTFSASNQTKLLDISGTYDNLYGFTSSGNFGLKNISGVNQTFSIDFEIQGHATSSNTAYNFYLIVNGVTQSLPIIYTGFHNANSDDDYSRSFLYDLNDDDTLSIGLANTSNSISWQTIRAILNVKSIGKSGLGVNTIDGVDGAISGRWNLYATDVSTTPANDGQIVINSPTFSEANLLRITEIATSGGDYNSFFNYLQNRQSGDGYAVRIQMTDVQDNSNFAIFYSNGGSFNVWGYGFNIDDTQTVFGGTPSIGKTYSVSMALELGTALNYIVLVAPNTDRYQISVDNSGNLTASLIP